ncbi:hypothetical protein B0H19DRAFT_483969 [Mycena capillaripes]|nr:hypothetical protein B0H19DRAFT_483969 [Mycena capillaripes]
MMDPFSCHKCGAVVAPILVEDPGRIDDDTTPGTRHHMLLSSNEVPLDSEVVIVKSVIADTDARLADIDDEIARLQERLQRLQDERASLSHYRARNHTILSSLRIIPAEVLSEIFSWSAPSASEVSLHRGFHMTASPWSLTHVSRRWRAVAISHPVLWSLFTTSYDSGLDLSSAYPLSMLETQLARAGNLKIRFYGCQTSDSQPQIETLQCLLKHASRWEDLSLRLTSRLYPLLTNLRGRVPSLRRLCITWDRLESQEAAESIDFFQLAPSLVDATVYNQFRYIPISLPSPRQLTRYQLYCPWAIHRGILKLAPNLTEVRIGIKFDREPWPGSDETIDLPRLCRLYVSRLEVLGYIRVPALQELSLFFGRRDLENVVGNLQSLIARSSCTLRRLCLSGCSHARTNIAILQNIPSIAELRIIITNCHVAREVNAMVVELSVSDGLGSTPVVPQLSSISFARATGASSSYFDYIAYCKMVESRWGSHDCVLSRAALLFQSDPIPELACLGSLKALRHEGLDFLLLDGGKARSVMNHWICDSRISL